MSTHVTRRRTDPERFDLYTRGSLYLLLAMTPLLGAAAASEASGRPGAVVTFLLGVVVEAGVAIGVTSAALRQFLGGTRVARGWYVALGVSAGTVAVAAAVALPYADGLGGRAGGLLIALGVPVIALAPVVRTRALGLGTLVVAVIVVLSYSLPDPGGAVPDTQHPLPAAMSTALVVGGMAASFRVSAWMLGVVWEQERTRAVHARLAVAEERLRFSRDLHDVVGRTLSAVALKSELAAELARRGQDGAVDQMLEVRELAQDSLKEVRAVVAGYRTADLAAELAGARSVLRSAGVRTRVLGEGADVPDAAQKALAWVVREAATNIVRHSSATTCTIDLVVADGAARLTVTNDGVERRRRGVGGSGLTGLAERLAAHGGTLETAAEGASFTLTACVPLSAGNADARTDRSTRGGAGGSSPGDPAHARMDP
ncbi:sensor histidine kinase [Georgenia wangjunii]|uniref:sensor histidine kinase n=1 Tax=Georgenia wangjunii TaxID=3117730 RepID=UPI002F25F698